VFIYTTIVNIIERPEGIRIAGFFIGAIIFTSLISRVWRSTELRAEKIEMDETASRFIAEESRDSIRLIANRLNEGDVEEYRLKEQEVREDNHIPPTDAILFLEIQISDASEESGLGNITSCGHKVLLYPMRSPPFFCIFAIKLASCPMPTLAGQRKIAFNI
jgi:hypothetical protein